MVEVSLNISVIIVNVNEFLLFLKRQSMPYWIRISKTKYSISWLGKHSKAKEKGKAENKTMKNYVLGTC